MHRPLKQAQQLAEEAFGIFRGAGKIFGFRANLILLRPIEELTVPVDAVTPHLTGLKSGSRAVGVLRQVRIFTDFLERTLSPEQRANHRGLAELLNMRSEFKAADAEVSEVFRNAINYHKASYHLTGNLQRVISNPGMS